LSPQNSVDPGQELPRIEGFGKVIVGAHLEAEYAIEILALGGEYDDGNGGIDSETTAKT